MRDRLLSLGLLLLVSACGDQDSGDAAPSAPPRAASEAVQATASGAGEAETVAAKPRRKERPLPAFSGFTLEGEKVDVASLLGRRLLLFFFNPEAREAPPVARAVRSISALRGKENFEIVGIAMGSSHRKAQAFVAKEKLDFRVIDDSSANIARRFGLRSRVAMLGVDAAGYVMFGFGQFPTEGDHAERAVEGMVREALRLPPLESTAEPVLGTRPVAPEFQASVLDGSEPFELTANRGRAVALLFFLHTCPHCHDVLRFMKEELPKLPEETRPLLVGVEVTGRTGAVRRELESQGLDFFPVLFDDDGSIQEAYGVFAGVPDLVLIDKQGRIAARVSGWRPKTDPPLMRMRLAQVAGAPVPMLLRTDGYSGNEVCGVCHQEAYETWQLTTHSSAFATLVKHGAETDDECVSCHVVGHDEFGGYEPGAGALENVGCESCHARGGPHLSPEEKGRTDYTQVCVTCHDTKHSLGFDHATFAPRVSHAANAHLLALPVEEKQRILAERGLPRKDVLPTAAAHVGSDACQSCHAAEFETWAKNPHAKSGATLAAVGEAGTAECLRCHTTAFGRKGGFPEDAHLDDHGDLGRVGCESCHGPGADHVAEGATRRGTIVSLTDKCDSCVILQICGGCHDEANDPGFEFTVQEKIEKLRHGTIAPSSTEPGDRSARGFHDASTLGMLSHAFAIHDERS